MLLALRVSGIIVKVFNLVGIPDFICFAHTLPLVIDDGIKSQELFLM